jgi:RimJ/RimL family protein N-acetyltransferase
MAVLETPRLILRRFGEEDVDLLAELMANRDFMRFSLGAFSREQTAAFLKKTLAWNSAGLPSLFAVIVRENSKLIGYCGSFIKRLMGRMKLKLPIDFILIIGVGDWRLKPRALCAITHFAISNYRG